MRIGALATAMAVALAACGVDVVGTSTPTATTPNSNDASSSIDGAKNPGPGPIEEGGTTADGSTADTSIAPSPGFLKLTATASPTTVDLTQEGTLDWIHLGFGGQPIVDRKSGVAPPKIGDPVAANVDKHGSLAVAYTNCTWSDGTPTLSVLSPGTTSYEYWGKAVSVTIDFVIEASATPRVATFYFGGVRSRARFTASIDEDPAVTPIIDETVQSMTTDYAAMYKVEYASPTPNAKLHVRYSMAEIFDTSPTNYGTLRIAAITLHNKP